MRDVDADHGYVCDRGGVGGVGGGHLGGQVRGGGDW